MTKRLASLVFVALLSVPSLALAGGCPTCTSDADCMPPGGGAGFCVEWSRDFGCGSQRIACCPGQACDTFSGRPSCEGADTDGDSVDDCRLFSGGTDAGAPGVDAGSVDAGPAPVDAGGGAVDAGGGGGVDAGPAVDTAGGCSCRTGGAPTSTPLGLLLLAGGLALIRFR